MASKLREVDLSPRVMLPPMSTDIPEQPMTMLEFLEGWILNAEGLKTNDNLPHLFSIEEAVEAAKSAAVAKSGSKLPTNVRLPADPGPNATQEQRDKYIAEARAVAESVTILNREHWRKVYDCTEGDKLTISDDAFQVACTSIKNKLDEMAKTNPMSGQPSISPFVERKVLRLYHAFRNSKEV